MRGESAREGEWLARGPGLSAPGKSRHARVRLTGGTRVSAPIPGWAARAKTVVGRKTGSEAQVSFSSFPFYFLFSFLHFQIQFEFKFQNQILW